MENMRNNLPEIDMEKLQIVLDCPRCSKGYPIY